MKAASHESLTPFSNCRAKLVPRNENNTKDLMGQKQVRVPVWHVAIRVLTSATHK